MSDGSVEQDGEPIHDEDVGASPTHIASPKLRFEAWRAVVWTSVVGLIVLSIYIADSLLVIFGALVFAAMIDGGSRLLGRFLPVGRGLRIGIVLLLATGFLLWLGYFTGSQVSQQAAEFPSIVNEQVGRAIAWLRSKGFVISQGDIQNIVGQFASGAGAVTRAIGGVFGGLATLLIVVVVGIYVALEPRLYERGVAWMLPEDNRNRFYDTASKMAYTMRRLMAGRLVGMIFEGFFTYFALLGYGLVTGEYIPMAALLAILTGLLAFVPNVGAVVSGVLMVLVGFSGGAQMGVYTIVVYLVVQNIDGYIIVPMIARKTVDLAPALVLAFQLIMGILFGILGLFLADPLLAMIKVALEQRSKANHKEDKAAGHEPGSHPAPEASPA
ncbi:AI-2E family transporter [Erythrobacter arachoides]|uniref:AI-2E family transporter n=1 Tax=Aurantiacibacter arachoides TaxID=1850444 RepID=A0A845A2G3_9SPHN|nr:AI-2E family transporter [Aurantiacibacter arachoides]MXO93770.1 AI-2E family transporter [Aurantiacibacter arachoides]GGD46788.1 AI-2E family transporter [Aurantiacibacter arachoides]